MKTKFIDINKTVLKEIDALVMLCNGSRIIIDGELWSVIGDPVFDFDRKELLIHMEKHLTI